MNPTSPADKQQLNQAPGVVLDILIVLGAVALLGGIAAFSWKVALIVLGILLLADAAFIATGGMAGVAARHKRNDGKNS